MFIVATTVLVAFWLRDFMCLRMSPSRRATHRALVYGTVILLTAVLVWTVAARIGITDFIRMILSPPILFLLIAFHLVASVVSIWVKQAQNYNWMWATALLPAPIVWFWLLEATQGIGVVAPQLSFFAVAALWASLMIVVIFRTRHSQMPVADLDCVVFFGSVSHWLAMCALPLVFLMTE